VSWFFPGFPVLLDANFVLFCDLFREAEVDVTSIAGWLVNGRLLRVTVSYSTHRAGVFLKRTRKTT
jgi:hypothetical protein